MALVIASQFSTVPYDLPVEGGASGEACGVALVGEAASVAVVVRVGKGA